MRITRNRMIAMRLALAGAGVLWLVAPAFVHAQVVTNPTSTMPMPTSSFPGPLEEPVQEPAMEIEYAYAERGPDPRLVGYLYIFAGTIAFAGAILMLFGMTQQALAAHDTPRTARLRRRRA